LVGVPPKSREVFTVEGIATIRDRYSLEEYASMLT
jgi:hypothetical protein